MSITIYKDSSANAIFIEDANGVQFLNSLQATTANGFCSIHDLAKNLDIVTSVDYAEFVDENGINYGNTAIEVCNALNALFSTSGTSGTELPDITSSLAINLVEGETLNYELTADYGVGYEWDLSSVSGVTTVDGNVRKLVGGSSLSAGTYNIPVKAINYNGEDSKTIVLTVSTPPFSNTKSVKFNNNDYLGANASLLAGILGRSSNGSGSADAWTISCYFKAGSGSQLAQTIFFYGSDDTNNSPYISLKWNGSNSNKQRLEFTYGTNFNYISFLTSIGSLPYDNNWHHIMVAYDGGTTGSSSNGVNNYYSRFKIFIDGNVQTTINSNSNFGYSSGLSASKMQIGRTGASFWSLRNNCKLDEFAIWDSDQSGNVSSIYNSGSPFDLSTLTTGPNHWWRMGDGDTYPFLQDSGSQANCVFQMYNMTSADIVNDVP